MTENEQCLLLNGKDYYELEVETDGTIALQTLQQIDNAATGLKYKYIA